MKVFDKMEEDNIIVFDAVDVKKVDGKSLVCMTMPT